ncbi:MAG TPA: NADH-quinone oxidoreductase subunit M [Nitrososphaerales archaeon]|nr:NADH-quinone oxidoreductase subunit M [Nitrososphaerales archaeon]
MSYVLSLLILVPLLGSGVTFAVSSLRGGRRDASNLAAVFAVATLLVAGYAFWSVYSHTPALGQYALTEDHPWITLPGFGVDVLLGLDGLSAPLILVSGIVAVLSILSSRSLIDKREPAYYALLLLALASVMGAFTSLNLVVFYLFWELTLIPMFFLIGVWGGDRRRYAALKFIIFTFAGSAVMLLGFLSLYFGVSASTFDIPALAAMGIPQGLQYLPLLAVFVGFAVELPVFPFHSWQPDAYEQAPAPVNSLLSGILPKFAGYAVIRIALGLFPQAAYQYAWAFIVVAIFSMFYGAVVALLQSDLKRMFAYTSISHMGFVLFGAFATVLSGNPLGIEGAILLMFTHALATSSLFTLSGFVERQSGTRKISLLGGMGPRVPLTAALLAVSSTAMMGIPPFASFLAELMVISGGVSAYAPSAITVLVPVITGGYFLWMLKRVIIDPSPPGADPGTAAKDVSRADATVVALYLVPLVLLTVFSFLILSPAAPVAQWTANLVHGGLHA